MSEPRMPERNLVHPEYWEETCPICGGGGTMNLSDCPELWEDDFMSEPDRLVECPECSGAYGPVMDRDEP